MAKVISREEIVRLADLAHISLSEEEIETYTKQIGEILEYVAKLNELDTKDASFKSQVDLKNVLREDKPKESLSQEDVLSNRKKSAQRGSFVISSVINK